MAKYVLQHGTHSGFETNKDGGRKLDGNGNPIRKLFKAGDVVDLTEVQAEKFADKFKSYGEVKAAKELAATVAKAKQQEAEEDEEADEEEQENAKAAAEAETGNKAATDKKTGVTVTPVKKPA